MIIDTTRMSPDAARQRIRKAITATFNDVAEAAARKIMWRMTINYSQGLAREKDSVIFGATPIDTGQARANWNISIGKPDLTTRLNRKRRGKTDVKPLPIPQSIRTSYKLGQTVYFANNLDYVVYLERDGISKQAPRGFIRQQAQIALLKTKQQTGIRR